MVEGQLTYLMPYFRHTTVISAEQFIRFNPRYQWEVDNHPSTTEHNSANWAKVCQWGKYRNSPRRSHVGIKMCGRKSKTFLMGMRLTLTLTVIQIDLLRLFIFCTVPWVFWSCFKGTLIRSQISRQLTKFYSTRFPRAKYYHDKEPNKQCDSFLQCHSQSFYAQPCEF